MLYDKEHLVLEFLARIADALEHQNELTEKSLEISLKQQELMDELHKRKMN